MNNPPKEVEYDSFLFNLKEKGTPKISNCTKTLFITFVINNNFNLDI